MKSLRKFLGVLLTMMGGLWALAGVIILRDSTRLLPWKYWAPDVAAVSILLGYWYMHVGATVAEKKKGDVVGSQS